MFKDIGEGYIGYVNNKAGYCKPYSVNQPCSGIRQNTRFQVAHSDRVVSKPTEIYRFLDLEYYRRYDDKCEDPDYAAE